MGQRLLTKFYKDGDQFATLYQHWDAYTSVALANLSLIVDALKHTTINDSADLTFLLYDLFGAWITENEEYLKNDKFRFNNIQANRNKGLIAFSTEEMFISECAAEKSMTIDLTNKIVTFDVFHKYESFKDYLEDINETDSARIKGIEKSIITLDLNLHNISFNQVDQLVMDAFKNTGLTYFKENSLYALPIE